MTRLFGLAVVAVALTVLAPPCRAEPIKYFAVLDGPSESPPQPSPGTGFAEVDFDLAAHTMHVHVTFQDLLAPTTASHIHSPTPQPGMGTAGVATQVPSFVGFPLGVTSGTFDNTLDTSLASTWNPAFIAANGGTPAGAEAALAVSLANGTAYLNIHTTFAPGGEIRGFLVPLDLPEPASLLLLGTGVLGLVGWRRLRAARARV
jgi:hypothetical protein